MILYVDTSALIKIYVEEQGSLVVRRWISQAAVVAMSLVGYAETRAGLSLAFRMRRINAGAFAEALRQFHDRWLRMNVLEVSEPLALAAGDLAEKRALRGFDAIHLASALAFQRESGEPVTFSAWDGRLLAAAEAEGLAVAAIAP